LTKIELIWILIIRVYPSRISIIFKTGEIGARNANKIQKGSFLIKNPTTYRITNCLSIAVAERK